jgi:hypothetical protein
MAADLPVGFKLDELPAGFKLDQPSPSRIDVALGDAKAALNLPGKLAGGLLSGIDKASDLAGGAVTDSLAAVSGKRSVVNPFGVTVPPEVSGGAGAITNATLNALPGTSGALLKTPLEWAAKHSMQSALKPTSIALQNGNAAKAINTLLEEGVNVTPGGAMKLRFQIDLLKKEVNSAIANAPAGTTVDKAYAASEIVKTLDEFKKQVNPTADTDAIKAAWQEFNGLFPAKIPVAEAQAVKEGTQAQLRDKYGRPTVTPAQVAAEKAMARGMRLGIEDAVPGVAEPNAKASQLINALKLVERREGMAGNRDLGGLALLAHNPEAGAAMLADRNPWFKSGLARLLYSGRERVPATLGALTSETANNR